MIKLKPFTDKQLKAYRDNPNRCPYCKSENIETGRFEYEEGGGYVNVSCGHCHRNWSDLYTHSGAGKRQFSEIPPDLSVPENHEVLFEFTIVGIGWGESVIEAWHNCMEGIMLEKLDPESICTGAIDDRELGE